MGISYGQFCPVSKAAEILCERWTLLIVRELLAGSTRFNELRRGLPGCSTALLTRRLRELERAGVLTRGGPDRLGYELTPAGWELFPLVRGLGEWGQRWARSSYTEPELDAGALMWDVRRYLDPGLGGPGADRRVVQFSFPGVAGRTRHYWVVLTPEQGGGGQVDVCLTDPGWEVDAIVTADLRALTRVWMGDVTFGSAMRAGGISLSAAPDLERAIPAWFGRNPLVGGIPPARAEQAPDRPRQLTG